MLDIPTTTGEADMVSKKDIENMSGIRFGHGTIFADDDHIFVICVRGLKSQVVASSHHNAVVGERINNENFVMNHCVSDFIDFRFPFGKSSENSRHRGNLGGCFGRARGIGNSVDCSV